MNDLDALLSVPVENRDDAWEKDFLSALPAAQIRVLSPEPREGPDHWPYLMVATGDGADDTLVNVLQWLSTRGIGLVVNPQKPVPDFVLTYGMIWNFRERGEFLSFGESSAAAKALGRFEFTDRQQLFTGPPSEAYFPKYARSLIRQFFADQGVFTPKVQMISSDRENFDLCFSIESLKSPPQQEHAGIAEAISWFLPSHYSVGLVSEKTVPGFQPL